VLTALGASGAFDAAPDGAIAAALRQEADAASRLLGAPAATATATASGAGAGG